MTKAIIFDLGGVLIDLDIKACIEACRDEIGFTKAAELLDPCHQKGIFQQLEAGSISPEQFAEEVLKMCSPGVTAQQVAHAFRKLLIGLAPYKAELLKELSIKYDLFLLSNNNAISMPESRKIFEDAGIPMDSIFKKLFLSYEMHLLKPSDRIFQEAIRQIQEIEAEEGKSIVPEEMLFIDDSLTNVEAARRNGLQALHYPQGEDLGAAIETALKI